MDRLNSDNYFRTLMRGNSKFFVVQITDSGYVIEQRNAPNQVKGMPSIGDVCDDENAVPLHSSNKYDTYHLILDDDGQIVKVPRVPGQPTKDENAVKFTRFLRKNQELIHGSIKQTFKFLSSNKLPTSYLLPFSSKFLQKHGLDSVYKNVPILSFIVTGICTLMNNIHPGYRPLFADIEEQRFLAENMLRRMMLENPLMHPEIWPCQFDKNRIRCKGDWIVSTLEDFYRDGDFPRLATSELMKAVELLSGE